MHRVHYFHLLRKSSRLPRQRLAGPSRLLASIPGGSDPSWRMFRVISIKVRSASYKQKTQGALPPSCAGRQSGGTKQFRKKVERTAHLHLSSCVRAFNPPNLDRSRPVTADNSASEWRINADQSGYTVLMSFEKILLVVRDQAHSLGRSIAL